MALTSPPRFGCEQEGFLAAQDRALLGSFDGRDARDLHAYAMPAGDAQLLVSLHEHVHHEFQWSTAWGLVAAMSGLLAAAGVDAQRLGAVAGLANRRAKDVHEVFATTLSVGALGVERSRALLSDNQRYLRYLERGLALGGDDPTWPWQFRETAARAILVCLMQPHELLDAAARGFEGVTRRDLGKITGPDVRLARVRDVGGWWDAEFEELIRLHPARGGDAGGSHGRVLPEERDAQERLKAFEETVLIPRLTAVARTQLEAMGIACLDDAESRHVIETLGSSFQLLAPTEWRVELLRERRSFVGEPLGAERERILIHNMPAVADVAALDEADRARFIWHDADGGAVVLCALLTGEALATQFGLVELADVPTVTCLAGVPHVDEAGCRHVPLALLLPSVTLRAVCEAFVTLPVLVLTSLTALRLPERNEQLLDVEQGFVLVDLPLSLQVARWVADGWTVRYAVLDLGIEQGLILLMLALEELPGVWFLCFRSAAGLGELAQLVDRHPGGLMPGLNPDADTLRDVGAVCSWLLAAWWRFQEAEEPRPGRGR